MLPLWREHIRVSFGPDRLHLVRLGRGLHPRVLGKATIALAEAVPGESPWLPAINALSDALKEFAGNKADVTVILSNHFVRYTLVPWNGQLGSENEEMAYARYCYTRIYGDVAGAWALRLSEARPGEARLASAVDSELPDVLDAVCKEAGLRLSSVQPYLMAAFNLWRRGLTGPVVWFVLAEQGKLCISLLNNGHWQSVRQLKMGEHGLRDLPVILKRELHLADTGEAAGGIYLSALGHVDDIPAEIAGHQVHVLKPEPWEGLTPEDTADYAMAMSG